MQDEPQLNQPTWWQKGVIYQIYPRSFMDSNGDGIGDLQGITTRLDYLVGLGIDAIWLSPIYPSPMADFGYDISDYTQIDPIFGSLNDFDILLTHTHARGLKLLLDFVPNHTSDEHPWFKESRTNKDNSKRNWYIWRDPAADGGPPNNWISHFGGSAWQLDAETGQYYLHLFDPKQPDLNWRNPEVRQAMYGAMRFWLERGVDGFRIDVLWLLIKDELLRDNPVNPAWNENSPAWQRYIDIYSGDQPEVHQIIREMRQLAESFPGDRVLIGEIYLPYPRLMQYYGQQSDEAHLPFNFQLLQLPEWEAQAVSHVVSEYENSLPPGAWPNWVLGNHDRTRLVTRVGVAQARVAQMLLLTLRGTPTCYYGDELGMSDVEITPAQTVDPRGKFDARYSRDPVRTPMQWEATSPYAGFSDAAPWLPLAPDYAELNVATEDKDPHSMLSLFRKLLQLRHESPALSRGAFQSVESGNPQLLAYLRQHDQEKVLVVLNFSSQLQQTVLSKALAATENQPAIICSTYMDIEPGSTTHLDKIQLRPDEGLILKLD